MKLFPLLCLCLFGYVCACVSACVYVFRCVHAFVCVTCLDYLAGADV